MVSEFLPQNISLRFTGLHFLHKYLLCLLHAKLCEELKEHGILPSWVFWTTRGQIKQANTLLKKDCINGLLYLALLVPLKKRARVFQSSPILSLKGSLGMSTPDCKMLLTWIISCRMIPTIMGILIWEAKPSTAKRCLFFSENLDYNQKERIVAQEKWLRSATCMMHCSMLVFHYWLHELGLPRHGQQTCGLWGSMNA